jgi:hypothetical protein
MLDARQQTARLRAAGNDTSGTSTQTYCFIPFTAQGCEFWVFRIRVSRRRFDPSASPPLETLGQQFASLMSGGTDFSGEAGGA